jgi:hypothetical protein
MLPHVFPLKTGRFAQFLFFKLRKNLDLCALVRLKQQKLVKEPALGTGSRIESRNAANKGLNILGENVTARQRSSYSKLMN